MENSWEQSPEEKPPGLPRLLGRTLARPSHWWWNSPWLFVAVSHGGAMLNEKLGESAQFVLLNHNNFLGPYIEKPEAAVDGLDCLLKTNTANVVGGILMGGVFIQTWVNSKK